MSNAVPRKPIRMSRKTERLYYGPATEEAMSGAALWLVAAAIAIGLFVCAYWNAG